MSLRTKSRMPASTSETAARSVSSSVESIFSERMAFIGYSPVSRLSERTSPARRKLAGPSGLPILTASRPICGNARSFLGIRRSARRPAALPAALEPGADAPAGRALRGFADRAGDADAVEQFLLGADLAQPFVVGGGKRLPGHEAGAGVDDAQLRRLPGLVVSRRAGGRRRQVYAVCARQTAMAGHRDDALLDDVVAVLQGQRILFAERHRLAQRSAEPALLLQRIDPGLDRRLVPDRAGARRGDRGPCGAGRLRNVAAV